MSLAGKFDDALPVEGPGSHSNTHAHVDSVTSHAPSGAIIVPDAQLLFMGDFRRSGVDLILSRDDRELVLQNYFKGEKLAALASPDGAHLTGDIVNALTGHTQYAQADGSASVAKVIGHVTKLSGTATVIRNGVSIILNQGDNVNKGDVVQAGSDSSLGLTFIDGTVFGLSSNAKMVLNEMIYDPNGSSNSSLISLVQGTISFVAGATAKHGDMKVDTPVATMGIRGTAVLVEIDFEVPGQGGAPPAKFQVLVEPDGTTGSYILFDKTTLNPIATVSQAGTQTIINGQGIVNFISSAQLSPDAQKIITEVFAQKFTDNTNPNTKTTTNFTDSIVPESAPVKIASGQTVIATVLVATVPDDADSSGPSGTSHVPQHIDQPPTVATFNSAFTEHAGVTGSTTVNTVSNKISFVDINAGDLPTAKAHFDSFTYQDAQHADVTATLTAEQLAAITAVEIPLVVLQDPGNNNNGTATWTYSLADNAFDFLAAGETLTLTYVAQVDNNFAANNETTFKTFTITITGTDDLPTIATAGSGITELLGTGNTALDVASGTVTFTDVDLTDRPVVSTSFSSFKYLDDHGNDVTAALTAEQLAAIGAVEIPLTVVQAAGNAHDGSATWTYSITDKAFDFLASGETLVLNYVAQVDDGHGGVVSTPISVSVSGADVTVSGTDDIPTIATTSNAFSELSNPVQPNPTGSAALDTVTGTISFTDVDLSDRPVASTAFTSFAYTDALGHALMLTPQQQTDVAAVSVPLSVTQTAGNTHDGSATWTYSVADGAFDFLATGEILTLTYTATVDDGQGGVITKPLTVTVTGTNDTPTIATTSNAFVELSNPSQPNPTGSAALDTVTGTISFTDVDLTDRPVASTAFTAFTYTDALGHALTLTAQQQADVAAVAVPLSVVQAAGNANNGSANWTYRVADGAFDFLASGEILTLTYTATVDDGHGGVITEPLTVTVTGTNDTPTIATTSNAFVELSNPSQPNPTGSPALDTVTGTISFTDVDLTDRPVASTAFTSFTYTDALGHALTLTALQQADVAAVAVPLSVAQAAGNTDNGSASWTYSVVDGAFDFLGTGEILTLTYTAAVDDGHGGVITKPFTVTITGTNDTPVVTSLPQGGAIPEISGSANSLTPDQASGAVTFIDVDLTDSHVATITGVTASGVTSGLASNNTVLAWLSLGTLTDSGNGATGLVGWAFSAADRNFDYLAAGEQLTLTYIVQVDDHHGGVTTQPVTITVTGANDTPVVAADASGPGASGLHAITERPATTGDSSDHDIATGALAFSDLDLSDTHIAGHSAPVFGWLDSHGNPLSLTIAQQGTLTAASALALTLHDSAGTGSGSVGFNYSAADNTFDFLAVDEKLTITYDITVFDEHNLASSQPVTITVTGTNDVPVAVADIDTGHVVEAGNDSNDNVLAGVPATTGNVLANDTDVDLTDTHEVVGVAKGTAGGVLAAGVGGTVTGTYGSLVLNADGTWTYTLDNNNPATDALAQGVHVSDVFSYTESDHHGGTSTTTLKIDITGANDAPSAVADTNAGPAVVEAGVFPGNTAFFGVATASGNVLANDSDVDTGDTRTVQGVASGTSAGPLTGQVAAGVAGTYGSVTIDADGTWTYTLDNSKSATQALTQGQPVSDVFTYTMHDAAGATASATLTIDITGTNDAPTLDAVNAGTLTDTAVYDSFPAVTGTLVGHDLDNGETATLTYAAWDAPNHPVTSAVTGHYGSLTVTASGSYNYVADAAAINALHDASYADIFTVQTTDAHGATGTATLTVNVTGANDTPTLAAVNAGTLTDTAANDTFGNLAGTLVGNDADSDETATLRYAAWDASNQPVTSAVAGHYGTLTVNADGSYSYVADASAINALPEGSYADIFTVQTTDPHGAAATATLTVNVTGADDTPVITSDATAASGSVTEDGNVDVSGDIATSGTLKFTDAEPTDPHTASWVFTSSSSSVHLPGFAEGATNIGTFTIDPSITDTSSGGHSSGSLGWSFTLDDSNDLLQSLGAGQTITQIYTVSFDDLHGGIAKQPVTVTIHGANDPPVITSGVQTASISGIAGGHDLTTPDTAGGTINFSDLDVTDTHAMTVTGVTASGVTSGLPSDPATLLSWLSLGTLSDSGNGAIGSDGWTFSAQDKYFDYLAPGEVAKLSYTVELNDHHGDVVAQPVTITITGSDEYNDVTGTENNDVLVSTAMDDRMTGFAGADQFVFKTALGSTGHDVITDFAPGTDKIKLDYAAFPPFGPNDFDEWLASHAAASGNDVLIDLNPDGSHPHQDTILLKNVALASLHASDFTLPH